MGETGNTTFANRGEAIPVIVTGPKDGPVTPSGTRSPSARSEGSGTLSPSWFKKKFENVSPKGEESMGIQDRMLNTLLQRMLPTDEQTASPSSRGRSRAERPNFSLPTMSNNFRRFNARIGVAFVFQARLIRLLSWRKPTQTMAFLAVYSFLCLNPYLLTVAPLAITLFFIMVPAFLARHPPPTSAYDPVVEKELELYAYPLQGPPVAPAHKVRPAPDLSKDFFRNMRDLQNSMEDFSQLHDTIVKTINPLTNFSNEAVSSALFLALTAVSCPLILFAHLLPLRAIFFAVGWGAICSNHPSIASAMKKNNSNAERLAKKEGRNTETVVQHFVASDIVVSSNPEKREVEIFELQKRVAPSSSYWSLPPGDFDEQEYEPVMFSSNPYTPLDPTRVSGARPKGAAFFEDVLPPRGWQWAETKWHLDLASQEWVGERCVSRVEVEMEGERWVWDIDYETKPEEGIADTYEEWAARGGSLRGKGKGKNQVGTKAKGDLPSWEEGTAGTDRKGEWRRRRWIRLVERKVVHEESSHN